MAVAISARTGAGTVVERKTACHIDITGLEAYVGVMGGGTITGITEEDPTEITSAAHGLETGDHILISGSDTTPTIDGARVVTRTGADTFTIPVNVTSDGTDVGSWVFVSDDDSLAEGTEKRYTILVDAPSGVDDARSVVFTPSSDGKFTWDGYIFPEDGSYTIKVVDAADGEIVATQAVTVTATP